jgi:hypothetical protein
MVFDVELVVRSCRSLCPVHSQCLSGKKATSEEAKSCVTMNLGRRQDLKVIMERAGQEAQESTEPPPFSQVLLGNLRRVREIFIDNAFQPLRDGLVVEDDIQFVVHGHRPVVEVGAADRRPGSVNDHHLGMQKGRKILVQLNATVQQWPEPLTLRGLRHILGGYGIDDTWNGDGAERIASNKAGSVSSPFNRISTRLFPMIGAPLKASSDV